MSTSTLPSSRQTQPVNPDPASPPNVNGFPNGNNTNTTNNAGSNVMDGLPSGDGPSPLVAEFILSAGVLAGLVLVVWWRRRILAINPFARRKERETEVEEKPKFWDIYLDPEVGFEYSYGHVYEEVEKWRWQDVKPISASYLPNSSIPSRTDSTNTSPEPRCSSRDHRDASTSPASVNRHADSLPSLHIPPPPQLLSTHACPPRMRISVLISMPTPPIPRCHTPCDSEADASDASSEIDIKKKPSLIGVTAGYRRGISVGDLDFALGTTEVTLIEDEG